MKNELIGFDYIDGRLNLVSARIDGALVVLNFKTGRHKIRCYPGQSVHLYRSCLIALNLVRDYMHESDKSVNLKEITLEVFRAIKRDQIIRFGKMIREGRVEKL